MIFTFTVRGKLLKLGEKVKWSSCVTTGTWYNTWGKTNYSGGGIPDQDSATSTFTTPETVLVQELSGMAAASKEVKFNSKSLPTCRKQGSGTVSLEKEIITFQRVKVGESTIAKVIYN